MSKLCIRCSEHKSLDSFYKHSRTKDGLSGWCKECTKSYRVANKEAIAAKQKIKYTENREQLLAKNKAYREANKEKLKAYSDANKERKARNSKAYDIRNKEAISARTKAYREANKEKRKAYYEANKEKLREMARERYKANKERILSEGRAYYQANKEWIVAKNVSYSKTPKGKLVKVNGYHKRRMIKKNTSNGSIPLGVSYPLTKELQHLLDIQDNKCYGCECSLDSGKHLDHHIPLSRGGTHSIDNVVWLCPTCNLTKSSKVPHTLLLVG